MLCRVDKLCYLGRSTGADAPHPHADVEGGGSASAGGGGGGGGAFALKSFMTAFNKELEDCVKRLVSHVEAVSRVRVMQIEADFIQDEAGQPWLIGTSGLVTAPFAASRFLPAAALAAGSASASASAPSLSRPATAPLKSGRKKKPATTAAAGSGFAAVAAASAAGAVGGGGMDGRPLLGGGAARATTSCLSSASLSGLRGARRRQWLKSEVRKAAGAPAPSRGVGTGGRGRADRMHTPLQVARPVGEDLQLGGVRALRGRLLRPLAAELALDDGLLALGIASVGAEAPRRSRRSASRRTAPHAHYDVPYKSLVLARLERQLPAMRGEADVAAKLREMAALAASTRRAAAHHGSSTTRCVCANCASSTRDSTRCHRIDAVVPTRRLERAGRARPRQGRARVRMARTRILRVAAPPHRRLVLLRRLRLRRLRRRLRRRGADPRATVFSAAGPSPRQIRARAAV